MTERKRIYVAYVGGTIGMKPTDIGYAPVHGHLTAQIRDRPSCTPREVPELADHRVRAAAGLRQRPARRTGCGSRATSPQHRHHYDGFVVLHGTDTMAYTASALAFLLRGWASRSSSPASRSRSACCAATAARTC